jgi:hypothetical protein
MRMRRREEEERRGVIGRDAVRQDRRYSYHATSHKFINTIAKPSVIYYQVNINMSLSLSFNVNESVNQVGKYLEAVFAYLILMTRPP